MLVCGMMIKGRFLILRGRFRNFDIEIYDMDMLCILVTELHRPSLNVTEKSRVTKLVYHLFCQLFLSHLVHSKPSCLDCIKILR